ncbi:LOW QUALITY PROTEIN: RNA polymerase II elongation factor ELL2-like [Lethenteron reissneri]|uniref:LOW QUALITY PROTEIN: RNA polymerase II elongation factor ELL2-like n=1 Tax=Lethenteron reissneri TaxID=7753 RepID=UPI002AB6683C|nr:LOW QUALITY PROTEIN: RNA polymerase II elongation factor ELL2-like [Lethenteron reissneri]
MAVLGEGREFALSCGRLGSDPERLTLLHVKLTDTAIKAFEVHQASKHSLSSQPTIRFGGGKGVMKIPVPKSECLSGLRCFSFDVSSAGRDGPQASLECIKQYTDSNGSCLLDCLGSVQDKITVCATDDSYQMTRERMTQAEEETRSRGVIEIKPGGPFLGKRTVRKLPASTLDLAPGRKRSMPVNVAGALRKSNVSTPPSVPSSVSQRSYRERVMHLLALKPYKKPELLLRLQRDGVNQRDKMQLSPVLTQVAVLNAKDNTFTLRDSLYRELQKDWPGYSEEERQLMQRLVARKSSGLQSSQSQNSPAMVEPLARLSPVKDSHASTPQQQKRTLPAEFVDPKASKKQRVSHLTSRVPPTFNGHANNKSVGPRAAVPKPHRPIPTTGNAYTTARPSSDGGGAAAESAKRRCDTNFTLVSSSDEGAAAGVQNVSKAPAEESSQVSSSSVAKTSSSPGGDAGAEPLAARATEHRTATGLRTDDACVADKESKCQAERTLANDSSATREGASNLAERASDAGARSRKKAKKNRDRERRKDEDARSLAEAREDIENIKEEMDLNPKVNEGDAEADMTLNVTTSTADVPDYVINYKPIASPEQRQSYKNDFNAEYEEYRELHARIENVTKHFVQLDAKLRKLQPSTEEYKSVQDQVLKEYKQIKKINPNFREQKHRCQYLHHKLSHIKHLIMEYDQTSVTVW